MISTKNHHKCIKYFSKKNIKTRQKSSLNSLKISFWHISNTFYSQQPKNYKRTLLFSILTLKLNNFPTFSNTIFSPNFPFKPLSPAIFNRRKPSHRARCWHIITQFPAFDFSIVSFRRGEPLTCTKQIRKQLCCWLFFMSCNCF